MLRVENVSTGYGKKQVLFDVSLEIMQGEIVLIAGSNGSGKSTLLKAIYGQLPLWNNGSIFFNNENITGKSTATFLKKGLLYIPQKNNLFEDLTVKENMEMAGLTLDRKTLEQRIEYALTIFSPLVPQLQRTPMKLSGGERKLLTLAMASLHKPKLILIDEPFTGLSPQNVERIASIMVKLNQQYQIAILLVEHRIKEGINIASKIFGMKLGEVTIEKSINTTFNVNELNSLFV